MVIFQAFQATFSYCFILGIVFHNTRSLKSRDLWSLIYRERSTCAVHGPPCADTSAATASQRSGGLTACPASVEVCWHPEQAVDLRLIGPCLWHLPRVARLAGAALPAGVELFTRKCVKSNQGERRRVLPCTMRSVSRRSWEDVCCTVGEWKFNVCHFYSCFVTLIHVLIESHISHWVIVQFQICSVLILLSSHTDRQVNYAFKFFFISRPICLGCVAVHMDSLSHKHGSIILDQLHLLHHSSQP